ncbi:phosphotransferase enzyme family protein [Flindersiella endophytica]
MSRVLRSLFTPETVAETVRGAYGLDVTGCTLIRSFVNDVYEVATTSRRYVLKIYHHGGWSAEEVAWEQELIAHLAAGGIAVSGAVPLTGGELVDVLDASEGPRPFAMTEFVDGRKPRKPFTDELYDEYGTLLARLHDAADSFRTTRYRRPFDLEQTLDEPLAEVLPALAGRPDDQAVVSELGALARNRIGELAEQGLEWGIRHGDVSLDNVHLTPQGLTIHDFDLAAEGWRVADLAGCLSTPFADAFLAGYTRVRELKPAALEALPWLTIVGNIGNLRFHVCDKAAWRGTESLSEGWVDGILESLRAKASELL